MASTSCPLSPTIHWHAHFIDFNNISLEHGERPEDLYQRLLSFIDDNLLKAQGPIRHYGQIVVSDEELTPLENIIVLTWLRLIHNDVPALVKQRYVAELRAQTLVSLKPEISQALDSLLDEIQATNEAKVLRTAFNRHPSTSVQADHPTRHQPPRPKAPLTLSMPPLQSSKTP